MAVDIAVTGIQDERKRLGEILIGDSIRNRLMARSALGLLLLRWTNLVYPWAWRIEFCFEVKRKEI